MDCACPARTTFFYGMLLLSHERTTEDKARQMDRRGGERLGQPIPSCSGPRIFRVQSYSRV